MPSQPEWKQEVNLGRAVRPQHITDKSLHRRGGGGERNGFQNQPLIQRGFSQTQNYKLKSAKSEGRRRKKTQPKPHL